MAKRRKGRINKTPIIVTGAVLAVGAAAVVGGRAVLRNRHPEQYIAVGERLAKQGDYQQAIVNFQRAEGAFPTNAHIHLELGKAYYQLRSLGGDNFSNARDELTQAVQLDPTSKEGWEALLEVAENQVAYYEAAPNRLEDRADFARSIALARDACDHLVKLDPDNLQARIALSAMKIRVWLLKMPLPRSTAEQNLPFNKQKTDDQKVNDAIADLNKLMAQHPENEMIPYWIARAKINQAALLMNSNPDSPDIPPLYAEAAGEFDNSIAVEPKVVPLYLKKAEILQRLQRVDPSATTAAGYRDQMRQALDAAQSNADASNMEQYVQAKGAWARYLRGIDPARSESVYRDLIKRCSALPNYQLQAVGFRIELADLLGNDNSREADALALLDAIPSVPPPSVNTYEMQVAWAREVCASKLGRANIEINQLARTQPGGKFDQLTADVTSALAAASTQLATSLPLLQAKGRFELITHRIPEAIQTLTKAVDQSNLQTGLVPYGLLHQLCVALTQGQQIGSAIKLMAGEIAKYPLLNNVAEIHSTMASLYLQNRDYQNARPHVQWLAVRTPDDPQVIIFEIQALGADPDPATARPLYDKLPEKTPAQVQTKLAVCDALLKDQEESDRLLMIQHKADPGAAEPVRRLVIDDVTRGDKAAARKILDDLIAARPSEQIIPVLKTVIDGSTPEQVFSEQMHIAEGITDPLQRERRMADLYGVVGRTDDEMKHLLAAEKLAPDDIGILEHIFVLHIQSQHFAEAEAMLPHLSDLNADECHGLMLKCKLCLARKDTATALIVGRQLVKDYPEFSGSWESYGEALAASGQPDDACRQFSAALDKQAANVDARRGLISCSVIQGKLDDARRYIADARARFPDDPVYREMQVNFEIQYGDPESIVPALTQTLKDHPDQRKNYLITAQALLASSKHCSDRGDGDKATQYLDRAKAVYQQGLTRWPDDLQFAAGLSDLCVAANDLPGAEAPLQALSERPRWKNRPAPLAMLAQVKLKENKPADAEALLRKAMADDPNYVQARVLLSDCLFDEKKYDESLKTLRPACDSDAVLEKYVDRLLSLSRGSEAEDMVVAALKTDPTNPGLTDLLIDVYQGEHKSAEAMKLANTAIAANPTGNIPAYLRRGQLEATGANPDLDAARKDLRLYCDAVPTDVRAHMLLAGVLDASQDPNGAVRELQAAIKYGPLDRQPRIMLLRQYLLASPPRTAEAQQLLADTVAIPSFQHDPIFELQQAKLWAKQGDSDRAVAASRDAMAHVPDKAAVLNDYLSILLLAKKYGLVLDESNSYAADPKTSWPVYASRGEAKAKTGDQDGAAAEFQTALDRAGTEANMTAAREVAQDIATQLGADKALAMITPRAKNSANWTLVTIRLYLMAKKPQDAIAAAESAMNSLDSLATSDQGYLLDTLSSLYITSTPPQTDKAMVIYNKMLARNPNNLAALNNLASVLVDMTTPPKPKEALVWSQKAYDLCKENNLVLPAIFDTQGWVLIRCGRLTDGIAVLDEAINKSDFPDAHYHLAMGYLLQNHPEDAKRELANAVKLMQDPAKSGTLIDPDLKSKIDVALKQADQKIQASAGAAAPG